MCVQLSLHFTTKCFWTFDLVHSRALARSFCAFDEFEKSVLSNAGGYGTSPRSTGGPPPEDV